MEDSRSFLLEQQTYLPLEAAAVQVVVFSLETPGFSQDGVNLEVDHVGHLMSGQSC